VSQENKQSEAQVSHRLFQF